MDSRNTIAELVQSTVIGALAFPAVVALLAGLCVAGLGWSLDFWQILFYGAATVLQGGVLGFTLGLAGFGDEDSESGAPREAETPVRGPLAWQPSGR